MTNEEDDIDEVNEAIKRRIGKVNFAKLRAEQGLTSVFMNEDGEIMEYLPNGKIRPAQ